MIALKEILETIDTLTEIILTGNEIGDEGAKALAEALKTNTSVTSIDLTANEIGTEGAKALAEALKTNTSVTSINLLANEIGTEGAKALAEVLKTNTNITEINLGGNKIGDEGAKALAEVFKNNTNITSINLWGNKIGDEGAIALAEALKNNTNITSIRLGGNKIGDEGAKALAEALKNNTSVTEIHLWDNRIGDEGVIALTEVLETNPSIIKLDLGCNNVNEQLLVSINLLCEENRQIKQSVDDLVSKIYDLDFSDLPIGLESKAQKLLGNTLEKVMLSHLVKLSQEKIIAFNERCGFKDDSSLVHYKEKLIKLTGNEKLIKGMFDQYTKITESCINLMVTFCAHSDIEIGLEENVNNNQSSNIEKKIRFFNQIRELLKNCTLDEVDAYCFGQFVTEDSGSSAAKIKIVKSEYKQLQPFLDYLPLLKKVFSGSNIEIIEDSSLFIDNDMIFNNTLQDIKEGKQEIDNEPELFKSLLEHIPTVVEVTEDSSNDVLSLGEELRESING